jgi:hypothetical protein
MLARRAETMSIGIDEFVLSDQCRFMERELREYISAIDENWRVYRYEDIIFDKRRWVRSLAEDLDVKLSGDQIEKIATRHDIHVDDEKPENHVRQVRPGNHRKHLSGETISSLNYSLSDILTRFCYEGCQAAIEYDECRSNIAGRRAMENPGGAKREKPRRNPNGEAL